MKIYGAGMAGLLAANMLRRHNPVIHEAQSELPNNHAALLRFRTSKVSDATHIPFVKVQVRKAIKYGGELLTEPTIPACNEYSLKVTGKAMGRSVWNLDPATRYIAPEDFISQCAASVNIEYNSSLKDPEPCISTIPMPVLMDIVGWKDKPEFKFLPIWSYQLDLGDNFGVYQTIYYADEEDSIYRASITGNMLIAEFTTDPQYMDEDTFRKRMRACMDEFGISYTRQTSLNLHDDISTAGIMMQKYGKLLPIDEDIRKEFILAMSDKYQIYSLGRFATWRQILMDDIVDDVKIIEKFITQRDGYSRKLQIKEMADV